MPVDSIFTIGESGLDFQRSRIEAIAANIANASATRSTGGEVYKPVDVIATSGASDGIAFPGYRYSNLDPGALQGIERVEVVERNSEPRMVFDPNHPDADSKGYVSMPNVDPVVEMTNLMAATRAYEANIRVLNAAKAMAMKSMELGE